MNRRDVLKCLTSGLLLSALPESLTYGAAEAPATDDVLLLPPYIAVPTESSVLVNLVAGEKDFSCRIRFRPEEKKGNAWSFSRDVEIKSNDMAEVSLAGLAAGTRYVYEVMAKPSGDSRERTIAGGAFKTRMVKPGKFSFAIYSDSHITPQWPDRSEVLRSVADTIAACRPDFALALGDNIQVLSKTHGGPFVKPEHPRVSYAYYRHALGKLASETAIFNVIGNWEGENGWHPREAQGWARETRMRMAPAPGDKTYPEGGSPDQNYYAFTWGDVLFVTLHATGYTPNDHALGSPVGKADDWTLGERQMTWLEECLKNSKAKWKFLFTHHTAGGRAGDDVNSRYGRGGALAAHVGEQQKVHDLMRRHGVQAYFYGHDHVFTCQEADGIPYICVGSAGAPWKFTEKETGYPWNIPDSGFVRVDMDGGQARVTFVAPDPNGKTGRELKHYVIEQKVKEG